MFESVRRAGEGAWVAGWLDGLGLQAGRLVASSKMRRRIFKTAALVLRYGDGLGLHETCFILNRTKP